MRIRENISRYYLVVTCFVFLFLPSCEKIFEAKNERTALAVFDDLWKFMDDHYALFSVKGVDWNAIRDKYRSRVSLGMSDSELFKICSSMLEELKDGHLSLIASGQTATYDNFYKLYPVNFNLQNVLKNYLKNSFEQTGPFVYKVDQGVGYLYYSSFGSDYSDQDLEKLFQFFSTAKGLIIDVRSNTGGAASNVNRLTAKFLGARRLMKFELFKKGAGHDNFLEPKPFYLDPANATFTKPVVVLTNRKCFSACNDFALYMGSLEQVKLVGDRTGGGGAAPANYILRNGWKLQYSASLTWDTNRESIESGISPDFPITISLIDDANGIDPILEKAFLLLK